MFGVGDILVHKKDICKIVEIRHNEELNNDFYLLIPISNESLKIEVPVTNLWHNLRPLISKEEVNKIIENIPNLEVITTDNRSIEKDYKLIISSGKPEDLIRIIKTNYFRNKEKLLFKKNAIIKESNYCSLAEKYIYEEFSVVLGISYEEIEKIIISQLNK